jgi:hypothetical protein
MPKIAKFLMACAICLTVGMGVILTIELLGA